MKFYNILTILLLIVIIMQPKITVVHLNVTTGSTCPIGVNCSTEVIEIPNFITHEECDKLVNLQVPDLAIIAKLQQRVSDMYGIKADHQTEVQIIKFVDEASVTYKTDRKTFILNLNDDFEGGELVIKKPIKAEKGKAVFFENTDYTFNSLKGTKYVCLIR